MAQLTGRAQFVFTAGIKIDFGHVLESGICKTARLYQRQKERPQCGLEFVAETLRIEDEAVKIQSREVRGLRPSSVAQIRTVQLPLFGAIGDTGKL